MGVFIESVRVVLPADRITATNVRFAEGRVATLDAAAPQAGDTIIRGQGRLLTPGLVEVHVHGLLDYLFDNGPQDLLGAAPHFARFGATTVLPTVVPMRGPDLLPRLAALAAALDKVEGVNAPGLHLEGPFLALPGGGTDTAPGDLALLEDLLAACEGRVRVMSVSPETPGILPIIERLVALGIAPFVTHTRATLAQTRAAIAAGARHATHLYNVFPLPPEEEPGARPVGAVEAFLTDPATTVDFIADGVHVNPLAIQLAVRAKSCRGVAVITDANIGAGLPPGEYPTPWGHAVRVQPGEGARIADPSHPLHGVLAGSALTMNVAMRNVLDWLEDPPEQSWALGTCTPARAAGLPDAGKLTVGGPADAVLWREDLTPARTWLRGRLVFSPEGEAAASDAGYAEPSARPV